MSFLIIPIIMELAAAISEIREAHIPGRTPKTREKKDRVGAGAGLTARNFL